VSDNCYRCERQPVAYIVTMAGAGDGESWSVELCRVCASLVGAAIDGRPIFSRGSNPKFKIGPRALDEGAFGEVFELKSGRKS
jgi:hypothetical protein